MCFLKWGGKWICIEFFFFQIKKYHVISTLLFKIHLINWCVWIFSKFLRSFFRNRVDFSFQFIFNFQNSFPNVCIWVWVCVNVYFFRISYATLPYFKIFIISYFFVVCFLIFFLDLKNICFLNCWQVIFIVLLTTCGVFLKISVFFKCLFKKPYPFSNSFSHSFNQYIPSSLSNLKILSVSCNICLYLIVY